MIVLDIESSGLDTGRCGIWQIGAIELENSENKFLEEARIDDEDLIQENALKVNGKTTGELRDKNKQSQKQMILNFISWAKTCKTRLVIGHNVGWDFFFIVNKCFKYGIKKDFHETFGNNVIDTYSIAQLKYFELNNSFAFKENGKRKMGLKRIIEFCGMTDNRINLETGEKGEFHNAMKDVKLTAECFSRLIYGKNLFKEFKEFKIPNYLLK